MELRVVSNFIPDGGSRLRRALPILAFTLLAAVGAGAGEFIAGADVSHLGYFERNGVLYREDGQPRDLFEMLKQRGVTLVRLRLFTSSPEQALSDPYNSINNLDYTLPLAVRAKQAGLHLWLDLHYSDSWADPGKQTKPAAWANLDFAQLEERMFDYNSNAIAAFRASGAMPEYVQVGNEITQGLLWPDGKVGGSFDNPGQWQKFGRLLNAAIRGIKAAAPESPPKILIHIDRGGDWAGTMWFFDNLRRQQVGFDLIGESYYPFWHGSLEALRTCLDNASARYDKPVIIAETAFPWSNSTNLVGFPATPRGQSDYVVELARIVRGVPGRNGAGIVWWGAEYQHLSGVGLAGFDRRSFFGDDGEILPIAATLGQLVAPIQLSIARAGSDILVQWPLSGIGLSLVTCTNLPAANWVPVTNAIESAGSRFSVAIRGGDDRGRFYRLEQR